MRLVALDRAADNSQNRIIKKCAYTQHICFQWVEGVARLAWLASSRVVGCLALIQGQKVGAGAESRVERRGVRCLAQASVSKQGGCFEMLQQRCQSRGCGIQGNIERQRRCSKTH